MSVPKVFILGIDGADWKVLDRMIQLGLMPNLDRIIRSGARGILRSTIPYLTPVAWSSLLTGTKPSKHGIFGYNVMENREGMIVGLLANRAKVKVPTVFDIYGQLGKKLVSVNMPMTYPPRPEDGTIITGLMTPSRESRFYYPEGLMAELEKQGIDYQIDISIARQHEADLSERISIYLSDGADRFFQDLRHVTEERFKAVMHLLDSRQWDLFQANFVSMDRIQHYLWRHIWDEGAGSPIVERIRSHFSYLDSLIGRIHSGIEGKAHLVICSDHGFGGYQGNFYPTVWLKQKGYYAERGHELTPGLILKRLLKGMGLSKVVLRLLERSQKSVAKKLIYIGTSNVYWKKTRAYAYSTNGIRINLKGRDQYGIVEPGEEFRRLRDEIGKELLGMKDARGDLVMEAVHFVQDLYGTADLEEAPDLFFEFADEHFHTTYYAITESSVYLDGGYAWRQGDHRRNGVVVLCGRGVTPGKDFTADIEDVLPTVLFIQGLPQSRTFDGKVMLEAFTPEFVGSRKPPDPRLYARGEVEVSGDDKGDEVIDRLKGLGYI